MIPQFLVARYGEKVAKVIVWIAIAVLLVLVLGVGKCTYDRSAKTQLAVSKNQAGAALESGRDAVDTVGKQQASEQAADRVTKENEDAIRNADGADAPVAGGVRDAGLASLCRRAAYRNDPRCLQHPAPR